MAESNKMREMPVNKLMVQMGIPMILSMALQAVYNIVDSAFVGNMELGSISGSDAYGGCRNRNRCRNKCTSCHDTWAERYEKSSKSRRQQLISWWNYLCGMSVIWYLWSESLHLISDR